MRRATAALHSFSLGLALTCLPAAAAEAASGVTGPPAFLLEGTDGEALRLAGALAGRLAGALQRSHSSPRAAAVLVQHAAAEGCTTPSQWPGKTGQIGQWRFQHLCLDDLESFDVAALDTASQSVSLTFTCWDGQMSGTVHFSPAATDMPEGPVEISAMGAGSALRTSSELQEVYGDRSMEIDDDAFFRSLAATMADEAGDTYQITLRAEGEEPMELAFPLSGFGEAVVPLRSNCLW